jgi:hypothetical protein
MSEDNNLVDIRRFRAHYKGLSNVVKIFKNLPNEKFVENRAVYSQNHNSNDKKLFANQITQQKVT